ncbi:hypothetical protein [Bradyrhizobium sp.]|uniref:hypothetical protein n=1 Tax=Bradyrhizobium sp. TaxID=376 RepID=UPI003C6F6FB0
MGSFWSGVWAWRRRKSRLQAGSAGGRMHGHAWFWLKALSQPTIDITLRTHAGLRTRIVESPGLSLCPNELEQLVSQLRIVAAKTLPEHSLCYGIFSGRPELLSRAIVTLICEEATGRPIAFNALSVLDVELDGEPAEVTHLGLVMVAEQYNAFCARELDCARGDDVLQLGRIDLAAGRRYLLSEVPHGSLPALLATVAMLALQRLVLPAVHWMDDTRAFGTLRPRMPAGAGDP